jgi:dipeptidyl aminopeptidase/acylaminoacyl peptidase
MKKLIAVMLTVVLVLLLGTSAALAAKPGSTDTEYNGNGAPSGAHYNLNIIGVTKDKSTDMSGSNGHVIFVDLDGKTRILLSEGDYKVLDANGTDGRATFQLPNPDQDNDGVTEYSVYVRALGKPNKSVEITPGAFTDEQGNTWVMSQISLEVERKPGKNSFVNASKELLYVWVDVDLDGKLEHINLFSSDYYGYFWDYDNNGCKLVQMRFYELPTTVPDEITPI